MAIHVVKTEAHFQAVTIHMKTYDGWLAFSAQCVFICIRHQNMWVVFFSVVC